jgi:Na+/H+-dicarboxylate symporter
MTMSFCWALNDTQLAGIHVWISMYISLVVTMTLLPWGPIGVATASAIRDAVTYKAVDIPKLKIISLITLALHSVHRLLPLLTPSQH